MSIHELIRHKREGQRAFEALEKRGHTMRRGDAGVLLVARAERLREEDRQTIKEHRDQFLDLCEWRELFGNRPRLI